MKELEPEWRYCRERGRWEQLAAAVDREEVGRGTGVSHAAPFLAAQFNPTERKLGAKNQGRERVTSTGPVDLAIGEPGHYWDGGGEKRGEEVVVITRGLGGLHGTSGGGGGARRTSSLLRRTALHCCSFFS